MFSPTKLCNRSGKSHFHTRFHHGNSSSSDSLIGDAVRKIFDLRPRGIIDMLDLLKPIYGKTAAYGHFGREERGLIGN